MKKIVIAIDGYSACGKSSTAKQVAQQLGYNFIDTGAMYRAVTLYFLKEKVDINSEEQVLNALGQCEIAFDGLSILLNGLDVDRNIRSAEINEKVSEVSAIPAVRRKMVAQQQAFGKEKGIVMDGRDIGTVVFPNAELKLFMTADLDVRVERRRKELIEKGLHADTEEIRRNLLARDHIDSTRADSPLRKADDAVEIDTTHLTLEEQISKIVTMAKKIINEG